MLTKKSIFDSQSVDKSLSAMKGESMKNEKEADGLDKRKNTEDLSKLDYIKDEVSNYTIIRENDIFCPNEI